MKLAHDWRAVLRRAWSIRLIALGILCQALEFIWPFLDGSLPLPPRTFAALGFLISVAAIVARLVAQKGLSDADP